MADSFEVSCSLTDGEAQIGDRMYFQSAHLRPRGEQQTSKFTDREPLSPQLHSNTTRSARLLLKLLGERVSVAPRR